MFLTSCKTTFTGSENETDTNKLYFPNEEYDSLNETDFENEPELKKILCSPTVHKCTTYMLYNGKDGFFNYTFDFKNMDDGFGSSYRFKLIDRDKLMVSLIEEWF